MLSLKVGLEKNPLVAIQWKDIFQVTVEGNICNVKTFYVPSLPDIRANVIGR